MSNVEDAWNDALEQLSERERLNKDFNAKEAAYNQKIHRVFMQTVEGKELLEYWVNEFVITPSINPESTQMSAALAEGEKTFVRRILLAIHKAEASEEKPQIFKRFFNKLKRGDNHE